MKPKLHNSKAWLRKQYFDRGKSIDQIAELAKVSHNTIRAALKKHGLIR